LCGNSSFRSVTVPSSLTHPALATTLISFGRRFYLA
jgi:hypothetical protein